MKSRVARRFRCGPRANFIGAGFVFCYICVAAILPRYMEANMPKVDLTEEDIGYAKEGLDLLMKSLRRSINSVGPGDIADAYQRKLAKAAAADSKFFMTTRHSPTT